MTGVASKFFSPYTKAFLKPFKAINKKIHEATGQIEPGGAVEKGEAGDKGTANFRQVGSVPQDTSNFPVQHLGDNK